MTGTLGLRRHLYEQLRCGRLGRRQRRALRRQIALLAAGSRGESDGGAAGVREPRRPGPRVGPERTSLETSHGSPLGDPSGGSAGC